MLVPIKYNKRNYPAHIRSTIDEIAGHFDIANITPSRDFCIHTEYSYGKRRFDSKLIEKFPDIQKAHKKYVPQLWFNYSWGEEFSEFIKELCGEYKPKIIEIHPPFSDYTNNIESFLNVYDVFEAKIREYYPHIEIVIENRCGSIYTGGKFIISNTKDLIALSDSISKRGLKLKIALDIPQLITSYGGPTKLDAKKLLSILNELNDIRGYVKSIHLWGKRKTTSGRTVSHVGDLTTYFDDKNKKQLFLGWFASFVNDGNIRYFVPEVNSSDDDLWSIVYDLEENGIIFGQQGAPPDRYSAGAP